MTQTITLSKKEMDRINHLLSLTGSEIYQKYGHKRDETITHTAKFPDGIEIDIKLVICEDDTPYTEGVLFQNGREQAGTEPRYAYDGEWTFHCNGMKYTVIVKAEEESVQTAGQIPA